MYAMVLFGWDGGREMVGGSMMDLLLPTEIYGS